MTFYQGLKISKPIEMLAINRTGHAIFKDHQAIHILQTEIDIPKLISACLKKLDAPSKLFVFPFFDCS